ncbi:ribonuclease T2 [Tropicimonas sp. IMCC34043]|uniref:ribonuclease T2 family protein n=1 Tax=Tropicimonas sp. IMCC34043 TaxID=2248760 RepID=UPI000E27FF1C|nr:ribonuclease T2 [Tropicimonas sp. IMCC34043]
MRWIAAWLAMTAAVWADGEPAGRFDYYVLTLSWSPSFCALEGDAEAAAQCAPGRKVGWVLHGLWPQYEDGWPAYCPTTVRDPSRRETRAMADIMGSPGLAWYEWKKHGRCSGLAPEAYFTASRAAFEAFDRPEVLRRLDAPVVLPARVIEQAWIEANPGLTPDMVTVTCRDGRIMETRICLTKDLEPRVCAPDVRRDCQDTRALLEPVR